jgi:AcrR family transcriptional regulator
MSDTDDLGPRERLVLAGRQLVDELSLPKLFAGATTAQVARRAGVTTGSFFHHFPNHAAFVDALVTSILPEPEDLRDQVDELVDSLAYMDLLEVLRANLRDTWELNSTHEQMRRDLRLQFLLWSHHDRELSSGTDQAGTVGDVLRHSYRIRRDQAAAGWRRLLTSTGRTFIEPFDPERMADLMVALYEGLLVRHQVDPAAIDDTLFADVAAALATSFTVPLGSRVRMADLIDPTSPLRDPGRLSPQARSGARRRRETRHRITEAATGMFDRGWETVSASEIAEAAEVSNQTVLNLFDSVREVAASTFVRHLPQLRQVAQETSGDDPLVAAYLVLSRLAELTVADPEPARALLGERVRAKLQRGGELAEMDIRLEVPIIQAVLPAIERMDLGGAEPIEVAVSLCDTTLSLALDRIGPTRPDIAELVMRLLPAEATGAVHWQPPRTASDRRRTTG